MPVRVPKHSFDKISYQRPPSPARHAGITDDLTILLGSLPVDTVEPHSEAEFKDVRVVGSYSWMDVKRPRIVVPGQNQWECVFHLQRERAGGLEARWGCPLSADAREMLERAGKSFESSAEPVQTADQDLVVIACDQSTELAEEDKEDWEMD